MENQNIKYKDVPLIKEIEKCNDNILYYGEGGIGKTTQMQLAFNYFSFKCTNTVPVFLDADKEIDFRKADPLMSAIAGKYLGSDIETDDIWKLFTNNSSSSAKNYTYIIFVDGINELTQNNKGYLIEKITHIIDESKNTRFIISSRIKENLGLRFKNIAIKPLEKKNILKYLGENYGVNDNSKNINDSLVEILQIPLYLSVFKNTYKGSDYKPNIYDESTVRKADILDSYIQKILHEKRKTNAADTALFEFIVKYFLPALAFEMVKENVHVISITDYRKLRDNTKYFEAFCYDDNALDIFAQNSRKAHNYIVENFALLESHNDVYTFSHQIWRDYFCAKHIINCLNVTYSEQIQNNLETPVDNEIRGFVGQLIYSYDEKLHYSKEEHFPPKKSDRMCECDFEAKDNLEDWDESPIEHYMQQHNLEQKEQNQISPLVTRNLIEIMKNSRSNKVVCNYSCLDLSSSDFIMCNIPNSVFENSIVPIDNFISHGHYGSITSLELFDDGKKIASADKNGFIRFWDTNTGKEVFNPIYFEKGFAGYAIQIKIFDSDSKIACLYSSGFITIYELGTNNEFISKNAPFKQSFSCMDISSDGKRLVVGCKSEKYEGNIWVFDIENNKIKVKCRCKRHIKDVTSVKFLHGSNSIFFSSSKDMYICKWNIDKLNDLKRPIYELEPLIVDLAADKDFESCIIMNRERHKMGGINELSLTPNNIYLLSYEESNELIIWNLSSIKTHFDFQVEVRNLPMNDINDIKKYEDEYRRLEKKFNIENKKIIQSKIDTHKSINNIVFLSDYEIIYAEDRSLYRRNIYNIDKAILIDKLNNDISAVSIKNNILAVGKMDGSIDFYSKKNFKKGLSIFSVKYNNIKQCTYNSNKLYVLSSNLLSIVDLSNYLIAKKLIIGNQDLIGISLIDDKNLLIINSKNFIYLVRIEPSLKVVYKMELKQSISNISYIHSRNSIDVYCDNYGIQTYQISCTHKDYKLNIISSELVKINNGFSTNDNRIFFYGNKLTISETINSLDCTTIHYNQPLIFEKPIVFIKSYADNILCNSWNKLYLIERNKQIKTILIETKDIAKSICITKQHIVVGMRSYILIIDKNSDSKSKYCFQDGEMISSISYIDGEKIAICTNVGLEIFDCSSLQLKSIKCFLPYDLTNADFTSAKFMTNEVYPLKIRQFSYIRHYTISLSQNGALF